jgi:YD repeat-containing protein
MSDGIGTTQYGYVPPGALGALRLQQETGPVATIAYGYDALGRLASRNVGGGAEASNTTRSAGS